MGGNPKGFRSAGLEPARTPKKGLQMTASQARWWFFLLLVAALLADGYFS